MGLDQLRELVDIERLDQDGLIEVLFKQIKQTLQLADFLGHNANAVQWQVGDKLFSTFLGLLALVLVLSPFLPFERLVAEIFACNSLQSLLHQKADGGIGVLHCLD